MSATAHNVPNSGGWYDANGKPTSAPFTFTGLNNPLCPDLLRIDQIGAADGWRGKVVRGFFRVLKVVTGV